MHTHDHAACVQFYRDVFGWETETVSDTDDFRYTTLTVGAEQYAGIMDDSVLPPSDVPPHWAVYFGVDDTDAALEAIAKLGGATIEPAADTPYGRLAVASDVTGAVFRLVAPNEAMPART